MKPLILPRRENPAKIHRSKIRSKEDPKLGGGFRYFLFSPLPGEMVQFD